MNLRILCLATVLGLSTVAYAQEPVHPTFGHSMQGDAFNEGPRQRAVLMKGIPKLSFPATTRSRDAQRFIEQGIAQIHAYWYFEAERSFRQAAALDPECAMAYWGMARSNVNNRDRARGFCRKAWEKRTSGTQRERDYIEAFAIWAGADPGRPENDTKRDADYIAAMRKLVATYPDDIEAKALLAHELQERTNGAQSDTECDTLLQDILKVNPTHPVHHYRIHLWDRPNNSNALTSAQRCGLAVPASAHMWHMEGHTYTQLRRYLDAAESQERSARTDHAHMERAHILPDQIFNYAHNNQWLVESLEFTGRATDAIAVAQNLVAHPRHPKVNNLAGFGGSANQGIPRLLETLERFELWETALRLEAQNYLEPLSGKAEMERNRLRLLACAAAALGRTNDFARLRSALQGAAEKNTGNAEYTKSLAAADAYAAIAAGNKAEALRLLDSAGIPSEREALLRLRLGQPEKAESLARSAVAARPNQVLPLAALVQVLSAQGKAADARTTLDQLRPLAARADLDLPQLAAVTAFAKTQGLPDDWRLAPPADPSAPPRPTRESLGPLTWSPSRAPELVLQDARGRRVSLSDYRKAGKPVMVVFFLGGACERCRTQLDTFAEKSAAFAEAGIELLAVSTDTRDSVRAMSSDPRGKKITFPVLADPSLKSFRAWGAYDDFEKMALHGTFLIDAQGYIRWQDTGFEPFVQVEFALKEAQRLLRWEVAEASR